MRVLQVTTSDQRRGAEVFAHQLGAALVRRGHTVTTAALAASGSSDPLPAVVLGPGRADPRTLSALVGGARAHDVVVAHGGPSLLPTAAAAAMSGRPFVYRNIGDPEYWGDVRLAGLRVGAALRRASGVVALYGSAADYLISRYGLRPDRVTVASNAADGAAFVRRDDTTRLAARDQLGYEPGTVVLGYLGALSPEKQPEVAVRVTAAIDDAALIVAGDGPLRSEVESLASAAAPGRVRFLGTSSDPASFLTALDVLLIPSRTEGVPGALLEAAFVGTPVVATAVGGVADVIDRTGAGLAVELGDEEALVRATRRVLSDPAHFVAPVRSVDQDHGLDAITDRWEAALEAALRTRQGRTRR